MTTTEINDKVIAFTLKGTKAKDTKANRLNFCFGVCRSGTTALAQVFGKAGYHSYYQPAKSDFRLVAFAKPPVNIQKLLIAHRKPLFIKETLGPLRQFEHEIDLIELYHAVGLDLQAAHTILAFRDPAATFGSWIRKWGWKVNRKILFKNFVSSELAFAQLEAKILKLGCRFSYFACHVSKVNHQTFKTIFSRSVPKIVYRESYFKNWKIPDFYNSKQITFCDEPIETYVPGLHSTDSHYYSEERFHPAIFGKSETSMLIDSGIYSSYYQRLSLAANDATKITYTHS